MQQKKSIGPVFVIIFILVVASLAAFIYSKQSEKTSIVPIKEPTSVVPKTPLSHCGLTIISPSSGAVIPGGATIGPVTVEGVVDNTHMKEIGCSWTLFEGQLGTAEMEFQDQQGWHSLGNIQPVMLTGDWMTSGPVAFTFTMSFPNGGIGLPPGTPLKIIFTEENPSGMPPVDTLDLPPGLGH